MRILATQILASLKCLRQIVDLSSGQRNWIQKDNQYCSIQKFKIGKRKSDPGQVIERVRGG